MTTYIIPYMCSQAVIIGYNANRKQNCEESYTLLSECDRQLPVTKNVLDVME
jgi:hypothetical protein